MSNSHRTPHLSLTPSPSERATATTETSSSSSSPKLHSGSRTRSSSTTSSSRPTTTPTSSSTRSASTTRSPPSNSASHSAKTITTTSGRTPSSSSSSSSRFLSTERSRSSFTIITAATYSPSTATPSPTIPLLPPPPLSSPHPTAEPHDDPTPPEPHDDPTPPETKIHFTLSPPPPPRTSRSLSTPAPVLFSHSASASFSLSTSITTTATTTVEGEERKKGTPIPTSPPPPSSSTRPPIPSVLPHLGEGTFTPTATAGGETSPSNSNNTTSSSSSSFWDDLLGHNDGNRRHPLLRGEMILVYIALLVLLLLIFVLCCCCFRRWRRIAQNEKWKRQLAEDAAKSAYDATETAMEEARRLSKELHREKLDSSAKVERAKADALEMLRDGDARRVTLIAETVAKEVVRRSDDPTPALWGAPGAGEAAAEEGGAESLSIHDPRHQMVELLVRNTSSSEAAGKGRDVKHKEPGKPSGYRMNITEVRHLKNPPHWKVFSQIRTCIALERDDIHAAVHDFFGPLLRPTPNAISDILQRKEPKLHPYLNPTTLELDVEHANECYLWHSCSADAVESILADGGVLDERLAREGGYFGGGLYFAGSATKADQYAVPKTSEDGRSVYPMLLCRVVLGVPNYRHGTRFNGRVPDRIAGLNNRYHSIVGTPNRFEEYVVYDRRQVYPEYLVWYTREM